MSLEREAMLERSKAQLELDWQRRCEDLERLQYERSESLIKNLTKARDDVSLKLSKFLIKNLIEARDGISLQLSDFRIS